MPRSFFAHTAVTFLAFWLAVTTASAHPVAQGSMDVVIYPDHLEMKVRAANEQAFVAEAFGASSVSSDGLAGVWTRHGQYLLRHIFVANGGRSLEGKVVAIRPSADVSSEGRGEYDLRYDFPPDLQRPASLHFTQDVLNELDFAPGNRWEATYVTHLAQAGQPGRQGLLFTSREPLEFSGQWTAAEAAPHPGEAHLEHRTLFFSYLRHGIMHILTGYDHLLFMTALVLAVVTFMDLVKVVTAFTVAHTITLTLSVLNWVRLPSHIVEPMIAASIVFVAVQNIFWPQQTRGWSRLLIAFGFGLFHGLGFAGGLLEAMEGLPGLAIVNAIVAFSLGVELGHQAVVLPLFGTIQFARRKLPAHEGRDVVRAFTLRYGSAAVSLCGLFYLVEALR